jgi:hypothetical protein
LFDVLLDEFDDDTPRAADDDLESFQKLPIEDEESSSSDRMSDDDGLAAEGEVQLESDEELFAAAEEEAETWSDDPVRMYFGRQPAAGRLDRQEVSQPRPELPGPDPGRQRRLDAGGRQVRISPRLQVLHLRHVVDSPGDHPGRGRPEPHDSHSGAHGRNDVARAQRLAASCCRNWAANRRSKKRPAPPRPAVDEARRVLAMSRYPISLDRPVGNSEDSHFGDLLPDGGAESPATGASQEMLRGADQQGAQDASATANARSSSCATAWATATATRWKKWATSSR